MRFRLGLVTGLAGGYYLGARAGRGRYDQINRAMARVRSTEAFRSVVDDAKSAVEDVAEKVTNKARSVVGDGVEKARSAVHLGHANGRPINGRPINGSTASSATGSPTTGPPATGPPTTGLPGDYSSSR